MADADTSLDAGSASPRHGRWFIGAGRTLRAAVERVADMPTGIVGLSARLARGLLDAVVVTSGRYAYRRPEDGVAVVLAVLLGS